MKRTVVVLLCVVFAGVSRPAFAATCAVPISYSLGTIDSRFNMTDAEVVQALADAEAVWEVPTGRSLFSYIPSYGKISVNFVYDERQAITDLQKEKLAKLEKIETIYKGIQIAIQTYASSTDTEQAGLASRYGAYKTDEMMFNAEVSALNARGGASQSEYDAITIRGNELKQRFEAIKATETELNGRIARFNTLIGLVNQLASYLNTYIAQYNATLGAAREYEEGIYEKNGHLEQIRIYQFSNRDLLVRALAHEMGHALSISHVDDVNAIMYRANAGKSLVANTTDLQALRAVCAP